MNPVIGRDPSTGRCIAVHIDGERISDIKQVEGESDCFLAPGFIDLQVNGYKGVDLNADDVRPGSVLQLTRLLAAAGTTTYLPTITTADKHAMNARLKNIATAHADSPEVRQAVPGIHLEGPSLSPLDGYRGAHPAADVRPPSLAEFDEFHSSAAGLIRIVTLSPHWPNSVEFIHALVARGIVVAIGHTDATSEQIHAAADAGATLSTHLGNGIAPQLQRHPNPIWAQLAEDRLAATLITDGVHLSADTAHVMLRAKTVAHTILISDSVALAGAAPGNYCSPIGGDVEVLADGSICMRGSQLLAGSGIALKNAVARAPNLTGCTLAEAVQMATLNPAAILDIPAGAITVGSPADLVLFRWSSHDRDIEIVKVLARGRSVSI